MIKLKTKPESTVTTADQLATMVTNNHHYDAATGGDRDGPVNGVCDLSILRKPVVTSVTSFQEAKKAFEHGTEEIKNLLANECDIIYECKVCRNIFRSLANFISHKRCYCKTEFNKTQHFHFRTNGFIDHGTATIIQAEQDFAQAYGHKLKRPDDVNKDLSSIVERLRRKQNTDDDDDAVKLTEYYEQIHYKLAQEQGGKRKDHVIQLDRVPESSAAVYQTIGQAVGRDNIKDEVVELHGMLANRQTILGPDGVVVEHLATPSNHSFNHSTEDSSQSSSLLAVGEDEEATLTCKVCNMKFLTEKTLSVHVEKKHSPSAQVYPCPSCNETFLQPGAVIRHLNNDHKKSMRRIRLMRDAIYKRSCRADEVVVKGPSRELSRLRQSTQVPSSASNYDDNGDDEHQQKQAYLENMENYKNSPYCMYCCKTFDRKAVLQSHIQSCRKKYRKMQAAAAKAASPLTVDLDRVKIEQRSDTPDSMRTSNSTDSLAPNGYHLAEIKQSNLHYSLAGGGHLESELVATNGVDTSESCSLKSFEEASTGRSVRNKRKRQSAVKIVNEEEPTKIEEGDELYWVVEDTDGVSLKKLKTEEQELIFSDLTGVRPVSTATFEDEDDLPFVSASEVEKEVEEAAAAAAAIVQAATMSNDVVTIKTETPSPLTVVQATTTSTSARKRSRPAAPKKSATAAVKEVDATKTIPCKLCPKMFATKRNLKLHVAMFHCRQNLFKCKFCDYHGYRKIDTRNHILLKHKPDCPPDELEAMIVRQEGKRQPLSGDETSVEPVVKPETLPPTAPPTTDPTVMTEESFDEFASQLIMEIAGEPTAVPEPMTSEPEPLLNGNYRAAPRPLENTGYFDAEEALAQVAVITQQQQQEEEEAKRALEKRLLDEAISKLVPSQSAVILRQPSIDTALTKKQRSRSNKSLVKEVMPPPVLVPESEAVDDKKKRRRRKKPIVDASDEEDGGCSAPETGETSSPKTRSKPRRSLPVKQEVGGDDEATVTKRPIRNRIKTVKEDFVYDLSQFLKKEDDIQREFPHLFPPFPSPAVGMPTRRPRALTSASPPSPNDESTPMMTRRSRELAREAAMPFRRFIQPPPVQNVRKYEFNTPVGAALKMAQIEATDNLACFAKPPEIPKERPQLPAKIAHFRRSDVGLVGWQALVRQSTSPEKPQRDVKVTAPKRSQRRASISSEFRDIRRRRKARNQKSPSPQPEQPVQAVDDISGTVVDDEDDDMKMLIKPKPVFSSFLDELHARTSKKAATVPSAGRKKEPSAVVKAEVPVPVMASPPPPSTSGAGKRITLLQRLAENKSRRSLEGS